MSRLVAAPRRIEFVCLRTDPSPQIALHLASQRRSYLRLRSLWLPPTWTLTMLIWRLHGRTHSRERGNPGFFRLKELRTRIRVVAVTPESRRKADITIYQATFVTTASGASKISTNFSKAASALLLTSSSFTVPIGC